MNDEQADEEIVRGDISGFDHFPRRGAYLKPAQVMAVVEKVKPGYLVPANVERRKVGVDKRDSSWVMRATYNKPKGGIFRASLLLPDKETAEAVERIIIANRAKLITDRKAIEARRTKERFDKLFGRSKDDDAATGVPA